MHRSIAALVLPLILSGAIAGAAEAQWTTNGVLVSAQAGDQGAPVTASDGAGGVVIAWRNGNGASSDIYAQRVSATGQLLWGANGVPVCTATGSQYGPVITASIKSCLRLVPSRATSIRSPSVPEA